MTDPTSATLSVKVERTEKKEAGYEYLVRWQWTVRNPMYRVPATVEVDVPNFIDLRVIEMQVDKKDDTTGTFLVTSTKNTLPARYNLLVSGRLMVDGSRQEIYAPIVTFDLPALDSGGENTECVRFCCSLAPACFMPPSRSRFSATLRPS